MIKIDNESEYMIYHPTTLAIFSNYQHTNVKWDKFGKYVSATNLDGLPVKMYLKKKNWKYLCPDCKKELNLNLECDCEKGVVKRFEMGEILIKKLDF